MEGGDLATLYWFEGVGAVEVEKAPESGKLPYGFEGGGGAGAGEYEAT